MLGAKFCGRGGNENQNLTPNIEIWGRGREAKAHWDGKGPQSKT